MHLIICGNARQGEYASFFVFTMHLTQYTDYSLRVLIYLGHKPGEITTISELAEFYGISRNHLMKVVHHLGLAGYVQTLRGKRGGIKLACAPEEIVIGQVVRATEPNFDLLECFNREHDHCVITRSCSLKPALFAARNAFLGTLDRYTLADAVKQRPEKRAAAFKSIPIVHD
jgi:Rrf2 family nitric oxide-sensitive transcriptional repressor